MPTVDIRSFLNLRQEVERNKSTSCLSTADVS